MLPRIDFYVGTDFMRLAAAFSATLRCGIERADGETGGRADGQTANGQTKSCVQPVAMSSPSARRGVWCGEWDRRVGKSAGRARREGKGVGRPVHSSQDQNKQPHPYNHGYQQQHS